MAKIKEFIKPTYGIFSNMPQDIWEGELDSTFLDVELFTRLSNAEMSPLAIYYHEQNDLKSLSELLYQRYNSNWKRIWDALREEYDIKITSTMDYTTERETVGANLETRALTDKTKGNVTGSTEVDSTSVDTGTVTNENSLTTDNSANATLTKTGTSSVVENTAGSNTLGTTTGVVGTLTKKGTDKTVEYGTNLTKTTYDELNKTSSDTTKEGQEINNTNGTVTDNGSNVLTKSGMESRTGYEDNIKDLTNTETGTIGNVNTLDQTGTGSTEHSEMFNGMGGENAVPSSSNKDEETRNFTDTENKTETRNLTSNTAGTDNTSKSEDLSFIGREDSTEIDNTETTDRTDTLSFVGRTDLTTGTDKHTGTVENDTTTTNNSTNTLDLIDSDERHTNEKQSGEHTVDSSKVDTLNLSDKDVRVATETQMGTGRDVSNLSNTVQGTTTSTSLSDVSTDRTGTVAVDENGHFIETHSMEGSTPLRTFQALINEELEGRTGQAWNFTNIIIEDVQTMITRKVWKKRGIWDE